jgi:hypothetical protein
VLISFPGLPGRIVVGDTVNPVQAAGRRPSRRRSGERGRRHLSRRRSGDLTAFNLLIYPASKCIAYRSFNGA